MSRGRFITVEGGEGAGKSTQVSRLCAVLRTAGHDVVATREPGGSPGAEDIRGLLVRGDVARWDAVTEALLHYAARRDHLAKTIEPALAAGRWVVSDRFADSTVAYQGYGLGVDHDVLMRLHDIAIGAVAPDLTIILDLPVDIGLERARRRGGDDRYERMGENFHQRLRDGFLAIAGKDPGRCVVIEARGDADAVHRAILAALGDRLGVTSDG